MKKYQVYLAQQFTVRHGNYISCLLEAHPDALHIELSASSSRQQKYRVVPEVQDINGAKKICILRPRQEILYQHRYDSSVGIPFSDKRKKRV